MIPESLLAILLKHGSPGQTSFSVEPAADCAPVREVPCEGARWSDFYGTWVRNESRETAAKRYELASQTLVATARELLCIAGDGTKLEGCVPYPGVVAGKRRRWDVTSLSALGAAVAQLESGYREDVMVGRGWAKKPSQDGGRGRGPSGEACYMQIHPAIAWRFADADLELTARAKAGDREAREAVAQTLLGGDEGSLTRCWRAGLRMLIHSRAYCAWAAPKTDWDFATVSMFGTGTSCSSGNSGKTMARVRTFRGMVAEARAKQEVK